MKHTAKRTGDGNYEYRGYDIQRDTWNGSSWSFFGPKGSGSKTSLKNCKFAIDRLEGDYD